MIKAIKESTTFKLIVIILIVMHYLIWEDKLTGGLAEYGIAITGLLAAWRHREVTKDK